MHICLYVCTCVFKHSWYACGCKQVCTAASKSVWVRSRRQVCTTTAAGNCAAKHQKQRADKLQKINHVVWLSTVWVLGLRCECAPERNTQDPGPLELRSKVQSVCHSLFIDRKAWPRGLFRETFGFAEIHFDKMNWVCPAQLRIGELVPEHVVKAKPFF